MTIKKPPTGQEPPPELDVVGAHEFAIGELEALAKQYEHSGRSLMLALEWVEDQGTEAAIVMRTMCRTYQEVARAIRDRAQILHHLGPNAGVVAILQEEPK